MSLLAVRGKPTRVFNVHLDTVPSSEAWSADPHALRVTATAPSAWAPATSRAPRPGCWRRRTLTKGDAAFLFSTDEEANDRALHRGLSSRADHGFREAIVAEPTRCEAVLAHRGISSVLMQFRGQAGHASGANALQASALHQAMRWGGARAGLSSNRRRTSASAD